MENWVLLCMHKAPASDYAVQITAFFLLPHDCS